MNSPTGQDSLEAEALDDTATIVRLYAVTDGRTRARHHLALHTVLGPGRRSPRPGLAEESVRIVELCGQRHRPLAELAGTLALPVTAVSVLVSDLIDAGALAFPIPDRRSEDSDLQLLHAITAGLKRRHPNATAKAG
ncbi:DUF742 domain-containing protein [Streptomyces caeruleatus]|uniref:DUF742 domain-containing protein n=1 Tax=Streptomyces caeruleatus TaxID=661399 RepID=A0A117RR72_9ACTN|nr:DUF742 domain-containing protein [Streptomyces caeruleatus]KUO04802.1 hypothetical protein AQJ67_09845 [Streptomyces caeruleatus]